MLSSTNEGGGAVGGSRSGSSNIVVGLVGEVTLTVRQGTVARGWRVLSRVSRGISLFHPSVANVHYLASQGDMRFLLVPATIANVALAESNE